MSNISQFIGGDPQYWVSGLSYTVGKIVRSPTDHQCYVRVVAGAGTADPANDVTNWRPDGARPIKSIQRGEVTTTSTNSSATVTIASVNTAKSELRYLGGFGIEPGTGVTLPTRIKLTNATTITVECPYPAGNGNSISWELTEYY